MYKIFPITVCVIASFMLAVDKVIAEPTLLIFGSEGNGKRGHTVFLGCISCGGTGSVRWGAKALLCLC